MKWLGHLRTINEHKLLVMKGCFRLGLYRQGILHDLSKYSPSEFLVGAKYYEDGHRSPNNAEREEIGYSSAWLHHKGRNKHHFEYWLDVSSQVPDGIFPVRMPDRYIAEMYVDRVAASKNYNKGKYKDSLPYEYFSRSKDRKLMDDYSRETLDKFLRMLSEKGEAKTEAYIRRYLGIKHFPKFMLNCGKGIEEEKRYYGDDYFDN